MNGSQTQQKARADWKGALKLLLAFQRHQRPGTLETVAFGQTSVDVYQPPSAPPTTVIFVPGLSIRGREDPRIRRLGWALSAGGLRVLVPDVPSIRALTISTRQPDEVANLIRSLVQNRTLVTTHHIALMSVSFSSIFVLRAALDPVLTDRVTALGLIGGYYDIERVADFLITSKRADPYGRLVIGQSYFAEFEPEHTNAIAALKRAVETVATNNHEPIRLDVLFDANDPLERSLHQLMTRPGSRQAFLKKVLDVFDSAWVGYRVPPEFPQSTPPVFLLHGSHDPVIPTEESDSLADRLARQGLAHHLCVSDLLEHGNTAISFRRINDVYRLVAGFAWFLGQAQAGGDEPA